jgi:hypothetical protein
LSFFICFLATLITLFISRSTRWGRLSALLLLLSLRRVPSINLLHDPLSPADRIGNGAHRRRNPRSAVVLGEPSRCQDAGCYQENALATLVHEEEHITFRVLFAKCIMAARGQRKSI